MNPTHEHRTTLFRFASAAAGSAVACLCFALLCAVPAQAQPAVLLPAGSLPSCPAGGTPASPCVTVTPSLYPGYFNVTFAGLPGGYTITNRTYLGWCADLFGNFNPSQTYTLLSSYATLPAGLISNWAQVNWLLNNKPTSIVSDSGQTITDPKTIRDVIQQVIWELLDGGAWAHYCCTLSTPYRTQYDGTGGGISIVNAINTLYNEAIVQTGFVPAPGQVLAVIMEADGSMAYSNSNLYQECIVEVVIPPTSTAGCFTTVTQGGWGAPPHGHNPGAILAANWNTVFPSGYVTVGGKYTLTFTSAKAVQSFLPAKGQAKPLTASYVNPTNSFIAGEFAGQVLALTLNVDFSAAGVFKPGLGNLTLASGPLAGWTVNQVLMLANSVLGGGTLPSGLTLSQLNSVVDALNNAFDSGNCSTAFLR